MVPRWYSTVLLLHVTTSSAPTSHQATRGPPYSLTTLLSSEYSKSIFRAATHVSHKSTIYWSWGLTLSQLEVSLKKNLISYLVLQEFAVMVVVRTATVRISQVSCVFNLYWERQIRKSGIFPTCQTLLWSPYQSKKNPSVNGSCIMKLDFPGIYIHYNWRLHIYSLTS